MLNSKPVTDLFAQRADTIGQEPLGIQGRCDNGYGYQRSALLPAIH
jgi:hypothetical protein